jgi:hypothetical protein
MPARHHRSADRDMTADAADAIGPEAGIVNPPGPKGRHWLNPETPANPEDWLAGAECKPDLVGRLGHLDRNTFRPSTAAAQHGQRTTFPAGRRSRHLHSRKVVSNRTRRMTWSKIGSHW